MQYMVRLGLWGTESGEEANIYIYIYICMYV